jgi:hypothetical protein
LYSQKTTFLHNFSYYTGDISRQPAEWAFWNVALQDNSITLQSEDTEIIERDIELNATVVAKRYILKSGESKTIHLHFKNCHQ